MINAGLMSSASAEWATPPELFERYDNLYNFGLDVCASHANHKCPQWYHIEDDGLAQTWKGFGSVWCNPPYGKEIGKWVEKCHNESDGVIVVALLPARTDTRYFHDHIYNKAKIEFLKGRVKFIRADGKTGPAPFPSMICIWGI